MEGDSHHDGKVSKSENNQSSAHKSSTAPKFGGRGGRDRSNSKPLADLSREEYIA